MSERNRKDLTVDASVVMLSYNFKDYVIQAIQSIVEQNTKYSFEVIIADDASQDGSADIIDQYIKTLKLREGIRIIPLLRKKNMNYMPNFIDAVSHCNGRYYMYCDGDDYWLPGKIETQVSFMDAHPDVGVCYGQVDMVDLKTGLTMNEPTNDHAEDLTSLLRINTVHNISACARMELVERYLMEENPLLKGWPMDDYPMWLWFAKNSSITAMDEVFGAYRYHMGTISHPDSLGKNLAFTKATYDIGMYFAETEEQKTIVTKAYDFAIAENHWIFGDMKGFRKCYKKGLGEKRRFVDRIKYVITYLPLAGRFIKKYYER